MARKLSPLGEFAGDGQGAVERNAGVEQRGELLGEEQNVAPAACLERGSLSSNDFFASPT
jgi:hypothetical protein